MVRRLPSISRAYSLSFIRLRSGFGPGREGNARAVGQHVPDGGAVLAVAGVGRQVLADPVVEREDAALGQQVHDRRRHGLGRGVHAERRLGGHRDLLGVGRIVGSVAPAVADRPVEDDPPRWRTQTWIAGCMPAEYQWRVACQMRSIAAGSTPEWSSSPTRGDGVEVGRYANPVRRRSCRLPVQRRGQVVLKRLAHRAEAQGVASARHRRCGTNGSAP